MTSEPSILGRTLAGRFRVVGFIGEGAMASVYRAVQDAEPRDVALKILHPQLVHDATFVGRFKREARAAARIQHPNVVRILDTGVDGSLLYIAMELLAGQDLFETLVLERRLSQDRAARILIQVTDALVAAHEKGVVHRDLKPENIMLIRDDLHPEGERVKVLDFGIAKILDPETPPDGGPPSMRSALTAVGTVVGTPAYMSPEQCRGEPIDHRSDVYTCGILLHQLVSGRLPFSSKSAMDVAVMHVRTPALPLEQIVPGVNRRLSALVLKALSKWPAQRQQTAAELRDALRDMLPELSDTPLEPTLVSATAPVEGARPHQGDAPTVVAGREDHEAPTLVPPEPSAKGSSGLPIAEPVTFDTTTARRADGPLAARARPIEPLTKKVPNPVSAPLKLRGADPLDRPRRRALPWWLIVPVALFVGIAVGVLAFFLVKR